MIEKKKDSFCKNIIATTSEYDWKKIKENKSCFYSEELINDEICKLKKLNLKFGKIYKIGKGSLISVIVIVSIQ